MVETQGLVELLQQHFEAYQRQEDALSCSAAGRAAAVHKQITVLTLNESVSRLSLQHNHNAKAKQRRQGGNKDGDDHNALSTLLIQYIDAAIVVEINSELQEPVERVLDLAAALAVTAGESTASAVVEHAVEASSVLLERVRGQACLLIGFLASHLTGRSEDWANRCIMKLQTSLISRLTDKSQSVRNAAILASSNCFENIDDSEELLETLLWNLWHDPSVSNRVAAIQSIPITNETVDHIIARVRDVKEKVRMQALEVLRTKVNPITHLTEEQLAEVIRSGLSIR